MADPEQWKCPWCGWGRLVPVLGTYRDHSACVDGLAAKAIARTLERDRARGIAEMHDALACASTAAVRRHNPDAVRGFDLPPLPWRGGPERSGMIEALEHPAIQRWIGAKISNGEGLTAADVIRLHWARTCAQDLARWARIGGHTGPVCPHCGEAIDCEEGADAEALEAHDCEAAQAVAVAEPDTCECGGTLITLRDCRGCAWCGNQYALDRMVEFVEGADPT